MAFGAFLPSVLDKEQVDLKVRVCEKYQIQKRAFFLQKCFNIDKIDTVLKHDDDDR